MKIKFFVVLVLFSAAALAIAADHPAPVADPRFEFLRQLGGTWGGSMGEHGEGVFEFRVTAGGTAIEEREMIGTPMEMVTVYHMEGTDLVGTHYCMLGNQPKVRAAAKVVDNALSFACAGKPGNAASHDDQHIHGWTIRLDDQGRLHYSARMAEGGEVIETHETVLTRR